MKDKGGKGLLMLLDDPKGKGGPDPLEPAEEQESFNEGSLLDCAERMRSATTDRGYSEALREAIEIVLDERETVA